MYITPKLPQQALRELDKFHSQAQGVKDHEQNIRHEAFNVHCMLLWYRRVRCYTSHVTRPGCAELARKPTEKLTMVQLCAGKTKLMFTLAL